VQQDFGRGGATDVASVRSCKKLFLCLIEPMMSVVSKMDPPLAKAEPDSDSGRASEITYLKRGKKP